MCFLLKGKALFKHFPGFFNRNGTAMANHYAGGCYGGRMAFLENPFKK
jgi:hypothetical protein